MKENREKAVTSGDEDATAPSVVHKPAVQTRKRKPKSNLV